MKPTAAFTLLIIGLLHTEIHFNVKGETAGEKKVEISQITVEKLGKEFNTSKVPDGSGKSKGGVVSSKNETEKILKDAPQNLTAVPSNTSLVWWSQETTKDVVDSTMAGEANQDNRLATGEAPDDKKTIMAVLITSALLLMGGLIVSCCIYRKKEEMEGKDEDLELELLEEKRASRRKKVSHTEV